MNTFMKIGVGIFVGIVLVAILVLSQVRTGSSQNFAMTGESSGLASSLAMPGYSDAVVSKTASVTPSAMRGMAYTAVPDLPQAEKKVVKNGTLNLKIDNADETAVGIGDIARRNGGEVFSSNFYQTGGNVRNGTITVRVPVAHFETAFAEIKKLAALVIQESTSGQDVTEQYVDLQAQLSNARAEEQTFVRILDQAQKIDDVLAVTRELSRVRGTIEQLQGKIKYLDSQTDMSTISVSLTENQNITIADTWRPFQVVKDSVHSLIVSLQGFVDFLIRFFIVMLPFIIIWGGIIWFVVKIGKRIYQAVKGE